MLQIEIPSREYYDEVRNEFITIKGQTLQLEHSLVSISKWESKWNKPFLSRDKKTVEEFLDYVRCMTLTQNVNPNVYKNIDQTIANKITEYIEAPMSATWFNEQKGAHRPSREVVTSELIYYWMVALQIPFECQKWHLNRLMNLVRICNIKNAPKKKMSKSEIMSRNAALNAARRKSMGSSG